jgi:hypothetical protein
MTNVEKLRAFGEALAEMMGVQASFTEGVPEFVFGFVAGLMVGEGSTKDDMRKLLEHTLALLPDAPPN